MTEKKAIDWMGRWYTVAKERGVNVIFAFGMTRTNSKTVNWTTYSHENHDGIGGMMEWIKSLDRPVPPVPMGRPGDAPPWWKRPFILWKGLHNLKSRIIPWKEKNFLPNPSPTEMEYLIFDLEETQDINRMAKEEGVGQNAYLLAKLHNIVIPELTEGDCIGGWVFPVNMRGNIKKQDLGANQSSGVCVECRQRTSARELHALIKEQLQNKMHWANWWVYQIGPVVRMAGMRYLSRRSAQKSFFYGTFSNLGPWNVAGGVPDEAVVVAPPGTGNYPVSCGVITWNGKLVISLKVHPSILKDRFRVKEFASSYRQALLGNAH